MTRLSAEGLDVTAAAFDVTDRDAARQAIAALGLIDILVNNVGHRDRRGVEDLAPADLSRMLDVHLTSAYALSQAVAAALPAAGCRAGSSTSRRSSGSSAGPATSPTPPRRPGLTA